MDKFLGFTPEQWDRLVIWGDTFGHVYNKRKSIIPDTPPRPFNYHHLWGENIAGLPIRHAIWLHKQFQLNNGRTV